MKKDPNFQLIYTDYRDIFLSSKPHIAIYKYGQIRSPVSEIQTIHQKAAILR